MTSDVDLDLDVDIAEAVRPAKAKPKRRTPKADAVHPMTYPERCWADPGSVTKCLRCEFRHHGPLTAGRRAFESLACSASRPRE